MQARARMPSFKTGLAGKAQQGRQWEFRVVLYATAGATLRKETMVYVLKARA